MTIPKGHKPECKCPVCHMHQFNLRLADKDLHKDNCDCMHCEDQRELVRLDKAAWVPEKVTDLAIRVETLEDLTASQETFLDAQDAVVSTLKNTVGTLAERIKKLETPETPEKKIPTETITKGTGDPKLWGYASGVVGPLIGCTCTQCTAYRKAHPDEDPNKPEPKDTDINAPYREGQRRLLRDRLMSVLSNLTINIKTLASIRVDFSDQLGWTATDRVLHQIEGLDIIRHQTVQLLHRKGSIENLNAQLWGDKNRQVSYPLYGCPCAKCATERVTADKRKG